MNLLSKEKVKNWIVVLIIIHVVGVIGLNLPMTQTLFQKLSELNLFISALVVFLFHPTYDKRFLTFFLSVFSIGVLVEIVGVKTGFPFGNYHYSNVLKIQLLSVPIIIGIKWVVLTYCTAIIVQKLFTNKVVRILAGAILMVCLDLILEHFAVKHNLWVWENSRYPGIANFAGWGIIALITHYIYQLTIDKIQNRVAIYYFFILAIFLVLDALLGLVKF